MKIKTKLRRLFVSGVMLVAAVAAFAGFINLPWFDEPLHPDLVALSFPRSVSMEGNSFPLLFGMSAASDENPLDVGQAMLRQLRERYRRGEKITLSEEQRQEIRHESDLDREWRVGLPALQCNSRLATDCASRLIAEIEDSDLDQPRLRVLLQRYEEILRAPRFSENEESDIFTPSARYGLAMNIARIRLAISYRNDTFNDFLARLDEDMQFWRLVLLNGNRIITKMVALGAYRNDLEYISALIRSRDLSDEQIESIRRVLQPMSRKELDSGDMFLAEMRTLMMSDHSLPNLVVGESWLTQALYQEHATLNEYYLKTTMPLRVRASLDAETFYGQRGFERFSYDIRGFPPPLYNLGGKLILKKLGGGRAVDYISRIHDVNGRISLVLLQLEIKQDPEQVVITVVESSQHRNPYTREAMEYDRAQGTIGFDCMTLISRDVCSVTIEDAGP